MREHSVQLIEAAIVRADIYKEKVIRIPERHQRTKYRRGMMLGVERDFWVPRHFHRVSKRSSSMKHRENTRALLSLVHDPF